MKSKLRFTLLLIGLALIVILFINCEPVEAKCSSCGHEIASDGTCPCTNLKEPYQVPLLR
jgi:hypothetical protein